ncbi:MAG TPA: mechanosensitive ion channel domain-containing protein, partial [Chitinophagaceae bacterium]|nr:mechanosensitive ion channel domain-containing protein [Chitinophagaceae bacterium]
EQLIMPTSNISLLFKVSDKYLLTAHCLLLTACLLYLRMQEFWSRVFLDNTIKQYAIVIAVIFVAYLLKKFIGRYVSSWVFILMKTLGRQVEKQAFVDLIIGPMQSFLFVVISYLSIKSLSFPTILDRKMFSLRTPDLLEGFGELLIIFLFFKMILRLVDYMALIMEKKAHLTPQHDDNQLIVFFKDFVKVILIIVAILVTIKIVFHEDISKVLAGLSIVGAAIALAARESLENLIASFIIFFDKPFTTGDLLKVNNITGTVESIGLRSTRIRTVEKTFVTVPNKQMVDSVVDNLALRTHRRGELKVNMDAKTSAADVEATIAGIKDLLKNYGLEDYNVQLTDIVPGSYVITADYLSRILDWKEFLLLKDKINVGVIKLMEDLNLSISGKDNTVKIVRDQPSSPKGSA